MLTDERLIDEIHSRLHDELAVLDPSDDLVDRLRARAAPGRHRRRSRMGARLGSAAVALATIGVLLVVGATLVLVRHKSRPSGSSSSVGGHTPAAPTSFVIVTPGGTRTAKIEVRSVLTGRVEGLGGTLHPSGPAGAFFAGGLTVSPDRNQLYLAVPGRSAQTIERIGLSDGQRTFVAVGQRPAISPDGRTLAYVAGDRSQLVLVRDLTSGATSSIRLGGDQVDLATGAVTWLGASDIAVVPGAGSRAELFLIKVGSGGGLAASQLVLHGLSGTVSALSADATHPDSLVLATNRNDVMTVYRLTLASPSARLVKLGSLASAAALSIDRTGTHILYLRLRPTSARIPVPSLWTAAIATSGLTTVLTDRHQVLQRAEVQEAVW